MVLCPRFFRTRSELDQHYLVQLIKNFNIRKGFHHPPQASFHFNWNGRRRLQRVRQLRKEDGRCHRWVRHPQRSDRHQKAGLPPSFWSGRYGPFWEPIGSESFFQFVRILQLETRNRKEVERWRGNYPANSDGILQVQRLARRTSHCSLEIVQGAPGAPSHT